jgi:hypothetical protein
MALPPRPNPEAIKRLYRSKVLGLPGPIDRWIATNERAGNISFLSNYLFLHDLTNVENVMCCIQRQYDEVSDAFISHIKVN